MTLEVLNFIDNKGGNAEEIRESQRKRGESVELVDEVIQMYTDWVKSMLFLVHTGSITDCRLQWTLRRMVSVSKSMQYRKKFRQRKRLVSRDKILITSHILVQAKEPADELVARKKELDGLVIAKKAETKEFEIKMRQKASTVGNIVGKTVPVSQTEVCTLSKRSDYC